MEFILNQILNDISSNNQSFQDNGFIVFRNLISEDIAIGIRREIEGIPNFFLKKYLHKPKFGKEINYYSFYKDALLLDGIQKLMLSPAFVSAIKGLLNANRLVYFGDSTVIIGESQRGFHKDNVYKNQNLKYSPDYERDYDIIRIGIYLQDVKNFSGGIQFRRGSHRFYDRWRGKVVSANAMNGDVVAWKLTTSHSGNTLIPRIFPSLNILPRIASYLPRVFFRPYQSHRISVFLTFAREKSSYLGEYMEDLRNRDYFRVFKSNEFTDSIIQDLDKNGVTLLSNL